MVVPLDDRVGSTDANARLPNTAEVARMLAIVPVGVLHLDEQDQIVSCNQAAAAMMGIEATEAPGQSLHASARLNPPIVRDCKGILATLDRSDGVALTVRVSRASAANRAHWLVLEDVTEWEALRRERQWVAFHDPVTGLSNRRGFEGLLQRALTDARDDSMPSIFGHVEIDDLEAVRESIGPAAGDELIRQVARALRGVLPAESQLARLDDVRFGVLIIDDDRVGTEVWAARLRQAVQRFRFQWQHELFTLGATVGLVAVPSSVSDVREMIAAAEAAAASTRGTPARPTRLGGTLGDTMSVSAELSASHEDLRWLSRLHRALKNRRFELVRQAIVPAVAPADQPVPMYEVLLRVVARNGSLEAPGPFIHAAEKFHLIGSVDRWVVREALRRLAASPVDDPFTITVNVSGVSLSEAQILDDVLVAFDETNAPSHRVCFEITETAAVGNLRRARRFVSTLRDHGCRFILDDFGSGLSSFAYLEDLDVDFLKIDGRFVLGMASDPIPEAIVTAVHQVAEAMGIATIGECVETDDVRRSLAALGVGFVQGFGIHRPERWSL